MVTIAAILAFLQIKLFPNTDWSEIDTTPLYWPETFEPYPEPPEDYYMDNVEMDCGGEYHGKEGKSEYGEYDSN